MIASYFHGGAPDLAVGARLRPPRAGERGANTALVADARWDAHARGDRRRVFFVADLGEARRYALLAAAAGEDRRAGVYRVTPLGPVQRRSNGERYSPAAVVVEVVERITLTAGQLTLARAGRATLAGLLGGVAPADGGRCGRAHPSEDAAREHERLLVAMAGWPRGFTVNLCGRCGAWHVAHRVKRAKK